MDTSVWRILSPDSPFELMGTLHPKLESELELDVTVIVTLACCTFEKVSSTDELTSTVCEPTKYYDNTII